MTDLYVGQLSYRLPFQQQLRTLKIPTSEVRGSRMISLTWTECFIYLSGLPSSVTIPLTEHYDLGSMMFHRCVVQMHYIFRYKLWPNHLLASELGQVKQHISSLFTPQGCSEGLMIDYARHF